MATLVNLLAEFVVPGGTIQAGNPYPLVPTSTNGGQIGTNQVADVLYAEVFDTVTGTTPDNVGQFVPVIDGVAVPQYLSYLARYDANMAPPLDMVVGQTPPDLFGEDVIEALDDPTTWALRATGLKASKSIGGLITATGGPIQNTIRVRFYGKLHQVSDLVRQTGGVVWTSPQVITDARRGVTLTLPAKNLVISKDNWNRLPGGVLQEGPQVWKFVRYALNRLATTPNIPYAFSEADQNVASGVNQDLSFSGTTTGSARIIQRLGLRDSSGNAKLAFINIPGTTPSQNHPQSGIPCGTYSGDTWFGWGYPRRSQSDPRFYALPFLPGGPQLLVREDANITVVDNGTSVPADAMVAAVSGIQIDKVPEAALAAIPAA